MKDCEGRNRQIVKMARQAWCLPDNPPSDEQILKATEGTLLRARLEFELSSQDLKDEIKKTWYGKIVYWLLDKTESFLRRVQWKK